MCKRGTRPEFKQDMNLISDATDLEHDCVVGPCNASHITVESLANVLVYKGTSFLCAEYNVINKVG